MADRTKNNIVIQARTWIGTPFHHQARLKGKGCDCLGLIVGVVDELGLKDKNDQPLSGYDEVTYSKEPDGAYLMEKLTALLDEVPIVEARAGDLALFTVRNNPQHMAFLTDYEDTLGMVHSYAPARRVVEHRLDDDWKSRLVKVFRWESG
jgi:NlpC/P60 family putative phage cell wall peptidase